MSTHESFAELPPRIRLYDEVLNITKLATAKYFDKHPDEASHEAPHGPEWVGLVELNQGLQGIRNPLALPTIGSDHASLDYLHFSLGGKEGDYVPHGSTEHRIIEIGLELFADGSPFIAEVDSLDLGNEYEVVVGRETPPYIAQSPPLRDHSTRSSAHKHYLTDDECEATKAFLEIASQHPQGIIGGRSADE